MNKILKRIYPFLGVAIILLPTVTIQLSANEMNRDFEDWVTISELVEDEVVAKAVADKLTNQDVNDPIPPYMLGHVWTLDINEPFTSLKGLEHFPNIFSVNFRNSNLKDTSEINIYLPVVSTLQIANNSEEVIRLKELSNVSALWLEGSGFSTTLEIPLNVESISFTNTNIENIIGNVADIKNISFEGQNSFDFDTLSTFTGLSEISLYNVGTGQDFSFIGTLPQLETVTIDGGAESVLEFPNTTVKKLLILDQFTRFDLINNFSQLEELEIWEAKVDDTTDLSGLSDLANLQKISINSSDLTDD